MASYYRLYVHCVTRRIISSLLYNRSTRDCGKMGLRVYQCSWKGVEVSLKTLMDSARPGRWTRQVWCSRKLLQVWRTEIWRPSHQALLFIYPSHILNSGTLSTNSKPDSPPPLLLSTPLMFYPVGSVGVIISKGNVVFWTVSVVQGLTRQMIVSSPNPNWSAANATLRITSHWLIGSCLVEVLLKLRKK